MLKSLENQCKAAFDRSWKDGKYEWTCALPLLHLLRGDVEAHMQLRDQDLEGIHEPSFYGFNGFGLDGHDRSPWLLRR